MDTVEVAQGATLTIEGGVTVDNLSLQVYGALNIAGTAEERVVFNSTSISSMVMDYASAPGAIQAQYFDLFQGSMTLRQSGSTVDNGYFNRSGLGFSTESGTDTVSNSVFAGGSTISESWSDSTKLLLENNSFYVEARPFYADSPKDYPFLRLESNTTLTGNNFYHEGDRVLIEVYSADIRAEGNYFGTVDPAELADLFYDKNDTLAKEGEVLASENRASPNPQVPTLEDRNSAPTIILPEDLTFDESLDQYDYGWSNLRVEARDVDAQNLEYHLEGSDAAQFSLEEWWGRGGDAEGYIYSSQALDFENPTDADGDGIYELILSVTDGLVTTRQEISIRVTDVNEAPTGIRLENNSVFENEAGGLIGRIIVDDPDAGEVYSFSIDPSDYDYGYDWDLSDKVEIVGDELRLKADVALDYESYDWGELVITATSATGDTVSDWVDVSVLDVNEAPSFDLPSHIVVGEHGGSGYYLADTYFEIVDPEWDDVELTLSGADAAAFESEAWYESGNFWLRDYPDFEAPGDADGDNIYELTVTASDGTNSVSKSLTIEVTDENDAPEQILFASVPVTENVAGAVLGTLSVIDQDAGDTHRFELWDTRLEVVGNTLKLKDGVSLDYEWDDSYVEISVFDQNDAENWGYFDLDLRDVNEAPIFDLPTELTLRENTAVDEEVYAWDPDWDDLTYELTGPDAEIALFYPREGNVEFVAPDFEAPTDADGDGVYEVTFKVSDGEFTVSHDLRITVTDSNERPDAISLEQLPFEANVAGAVVGVVTVSDQDAGDTHRVTVSDTRFEVVEGLLKLKASESLDAATLNGLNLKLTATDSAELSLTRSFKIEVEDPAQAPTALTLTNAFVAENAAGAVIGRLTVTDPNAGDSHSFAVSDDRFEVVGGVLKLKAGVALDHEAAEAVSVTVTAKDSGELELAKTFSVQVSDASEVATGLTLSAASVAENAAGAVVGQLSVVDPDAGDSHSFAVSDDRFEVVGGALKLKAKTSLDFEEAHSISLAVTATDAADLSLTQNFMIDIQDVAEGTLAPVDNVVSGGKSADVLEGAKGNDVLVGNGGKDTINGGKGKDVVAGGAGADTLSGGKGFDTLDYSGSAKGVTVNLQKGVGKGGEAQGDKLSGFEGVIGSAADDKLLGSKGGNVLIGGQGADVLNGRGGQDWADYSASEGGVTVNLAKRSGSGGDAEGDRLVSIERVHGSAQNDKLTGDNGKNVLVGDAGRDKLAGGGGKDKLSGGEGNDKLVGGAGKDWLDGGTGNDTVLGGGGADTFIFGQGSDKLVGGKGRDTVEFDGAFDDYGVTFGKKVIVSFEDDRDVLTGMERLEFDDITYAWQGGDWVEVA